MSVELTCEKCGHIATSIAMIREHTAFSLCSEPKPPAKKRGRPRRRNNEGSTTVGVRLTDSELVQLRMYAQNMRQSLPAILRICAFLHMKETTGRVPDVITGEGDGSVGPIFQGDGAPANYRWVIREVVSAMMDIPIKVEHRAEVKELLDRLLAL